MTDAGPNPTDSSSHARNVSARYPCSSCGAELAFAPSQQSLRCPYCGSVESIPESDAVIVEHSFDEAIQLPPQGTIEGLECEVRCDVCGVMLLLPAKTVTDACPYCGSTITNEPQAAEKMHPPESLLPFRLERRDAVQAFRRWLSGLWFAPSDLSKLATNGQLFGLYVPYWTFDSQTESHYVGQRGDHYWVTVVENHRDAQGKMTQQTRQVMKTRWSPASGTVEHHFDDVLVAASHSLPADSLQALEPWDLAALVPFDSAYLSGFQTERYQIVLRDGFKLAGNIMDQKIRQLCRAAIGGDVQQLSSVQTHHHDIMFKQLLLPVWHSIYRYHQREFHFVINARTGAVAGARPISWWKVTGAVVSGIGVAALVYLLAMVFTR